MDFEFEKLIPKDDPDSQFYQTHRETFGYDNDFIIISITDSSGLFNADFLTRVKSFSQSLGTIGSISQVFSPIDQKHFVNGPTGLLAFPLIHADKPDLLVEDSLRIFTSEFYSSFFSKDKTSLMLYLTHTHFLDQEESQLLIDKIERLSNHHNLNVKIVGKLIAQNEFIRFIQNDLAKFLVGSILLSFLLLYLVFRSINASILPFLISLLTIIWLFGIMGLLGVKINLLSSLLPPLLLFVSMSDAVHVMNAIYRSENKSKVERIKNALRSVLTPTFLTSLTTAIGFLSLLWINTEPIQLLGLFAALGVMVAFVLTFTVGLLVALYIPENRNKPFLRIPSYFAPFLLKKQRLVVSILLVLIGLMVPGLLKLKVDAYLLDDLPKNSVIPQNFEYLDEQFYGSKPYEMRIDVKEPYKLWSSEVMNEIQKIEEYLKQEYPVGRTQGPVSLIKYLNQVNNGGLDEYFTLPEKKNDFAKAYKLSRRIDQRVVQRLITNDQQSCRITGFIPEFGSLETAKRNQRLLNYLDRVIDHTKINYRITGTTFLIDKSHELLSENLVKGLLTAILIIGIVLGIYFKSLKLLLISLLPNIIPLLFVAGILGWFDISLKMTTSIIFTVAFGIAVDDTIHMMSYFMKNNKRGDASLKDTFDHAGSAILITSLIVIVGFSIFLLSSFGATFYLGLFISLSLLTALAVDLTLLPLVLIKLKNDA